MVEWQTYYELEPWGEDRGDLRMGVQTATLVNLWRDPKRGKPATPDQFMPYLDRPANRQKSPDELRAAFDSIIGG